MEEKNSGRVIKFRAWDTRAKTWLPPATIAVEGMGTVLQYRENGWRDTNTDHIEVLRFTGLRDAKRVEIYEGDIVLSEGRHLEVYWDDDMNGFQLRSKNGLYQTPLMPREEVIGNIYENPELLK